MTTYKGIEICPTLVKKDGDIKLPSKGVIDDIIQRLERDNHTFVGKYHSANSILIDFKCGHTPQSMFARNYTHGGHKCYDCNPIIEYKDFKRKVYALKQYELWLVVLSFNGLYEAGQHDGYWNLSKYIPEGTHQSDIEDYERGYIRGQEKCIELYKAGAIKDRPLSVPQKKSFLSKLFGW
ncbi:hypothetical protein ACFPES_12515 [Paenibacillus sp. GCM10023248]|uniref:hypothetical protein n=1 Tax=unclassified Paenibacillus TaxID=185978 RepID=UPI002378FF72|nr:hypothetical protein [Paenibacillus sp. MAHUQ-63]MDD9267851.1 hypothetical protein [Paenibacillus sp. MAHUQ-63]